MGTHEYYFQVFLELHQSKRKVKEAGISVSLQVAVTLCFNIAARTLRNIAREHCLIELLKVVVYTSFSEY